MPEARRRWSTMLQRGP